jgi:hypothetical protein|tara:strand:- start:72 stop:593 length:522 start_codon:yes stop_codon:yes gene_type:complete
MKKFSELTEVAEDELSTIYCDLDQVLVALLKGADKVVPGGSFATAPKDIRWKAIQQTKDFWANLDWMPGAKRLHDFIIRYDAHVLSAFSGRDPTSKVGKMKWLKKNTKFKRANIHLVKRSQKQAYAKNRDGEPNILIDDYIKNINEWETKGGIGIHHTAVGKTIGKLKKLGFK